MITFVLTDEDECGEDAFLGLVDAESEDKAIEWLIEHTPADQEAFDQGRLRLNEVRFHYRPEPMTADEVEVRDQISDMREDRGEDYRG